MKKKLLITLGILVIIIVAGLFFLMDGLSEGADISLNGITLSNKFDGSYTGTYELKRWTNTLVVQVKDHKIISIELDKDVAAAGITDCANEMFQRVLVAQDTIVDTVSGATVTSKAYLKAIEDALK